jgi:hypothetical protein
MPEYVPTDDTVLVKISNGGYATSPEEATVSQHLPGSDTKGMVVPGIPDQIERPKLLDWIKSLGIDYEHLVELQIFHDAVVVEMFALDADGKRYWVHDPKGEDHAAVHRISIPVRP